MRHTTQKNVTRAAGGKLEELLVGGADRHIVLLLSGGSALDALTDVDISTVAKNLTITMLDERMSSDPDISNFAQLTKTDFYQKAKKAGTHFIDTRPAEGEDVETLVKRLNGMLAAVFAGYEDATVIVTMGMGPDGHTAGIMPYPDDAEYFMSTFMDTEKHYVGYDAGTKNEFPLRVTVTGMFLKERVHHAILYTVGEEKKESFTKMRNIDGAVHELPARILHKMKDVSIFTNIK